MNFSSEKAQIFIPDNEEPNKAFERTTHLAISAHQDDIEIMACDGILKCFEKTDKWFCGAVITDGAGSSKVGRYKDFTDEQIIELRIKEQKKAAYIGEYGALLMLNYKSKDVKNKNNKNILGDIKTIIEYTRPDIVYTHSLTERHQTHVATAIRVIKAFKEIDVSIRPKKLYGCEVWGSLDWLSQEDKVVFDVSNNANILQALIGVFNSQICDDKRYDTATIARRESNATFSKITTEKGAKFVNYAMDMTNIMGASNKEVLNYLERQIEKFKRESHYNVTKLL